MFHDETLLCEKEHNLNFLTNSLQLGNVKPDNQCQSCKHLLDTGPMYYNIQQRKLDDSVKFKKNNTLLMNMT